MSCFVFLGPTLPAAEAASVLDAVWLPPVRQGDLLRLVRRERPRAVGIVDGYFREVPACWHKEVLDALAHGVHVFGAASMGALRAAELDRFGMVGVGRVYEAYRSGTFEPYRGEPFEDDDEVAILHGPAEAGYVTLSEAMVDIRATLARAADEGVLGLRMRDSLAAAVKGLFYGERTYAALLAAGPALGLDGAELSALARWLPHGRVATKRADAIAMLEAMGTFLAGDPPPFEAAFRLKASAAWRDALAEADGPARCRASGIAELVLDEALLQPDIAGDLLRRAVERQAALAAADRAGIASDAAAERRSAAAIRMARGLARQRDLAAWCSALDLQDDAFARLAVDEARLRALTDGEAASVGHCALDLLRLDGNYRALRERALAKRDALAGAAEPDLGEADVRELVLWHALLREQPAPASIDGYAQSLGFADGSELARALWRERTWQRGFIAHDPVGGGCGTA